MAFNTETITWYAENGGSSVALAGAGDYVKIDELAISRELQLAQGIRAAVSIPHDRRNQAGRRSFTVALAPAASVSAARTAIETLESALRDLVPVTPILKWVFGDKLHTFADAALEAASFEQRGVAVVAHYTFRYGSKTTEDVA